VIKISHVYRRVIVANVAPFAPGVMKVEYSQTLGGATNIINRMFYSFTGALASTGAANIASTVNGYWAASLSPHLTAHHSLISVKVTDLGSAQGAVGEVVGTAVGTIPIAGFLPAKDCVVNHATINRRYRGGKPRWYQSGFTQSNLVDNQHWDSTFIGTWEAAFNTFAKDLLSYSGGGVTITNIVNLSLVSGYTWHESTLPSGNVKWEKVPTYRAQALTDVVSDWVADSVVGSQRRRGTNG